MAKVDLKWAYRSVGTRKAHNTLAGLKWIFRGDSRPTYLCDQRLLFGSRMSPSAFNRITQAVRRMLADKGIPCTAYLDDFFFSGHDFDRCQKCFKYTYTAFTFAWLQNKLEEGCRSSSLVYNFMLSKAFLSTSRQPRWVSGLMRSRVHSL